jgi:hypothetical protein
LMTLAPPLSVFPARIRSRMAFLSASEVLVHSHRLWAPFQPQQLKFRGAASSLLAFVHGFFPWGSFFFPRRWAWRFQLSLASRSAGFGRGIRAPLGLFLDEPGPREFETGPHPKHFTHLWP